MRRAALPGEEGCAARLCQGELSAPAGAGSGFTGRNTSVTVPAPCQPLHVRSAAPSACASLFEGLLFSHLFLPLQGIFPLAFSRGFTSPVRALVCSPDLGKGPGSVGLTRAGLPHGAWFSLLPKIPNLSFQRGGALILQPHAHGRLWAQR